MGEVSKEKKKEGEKKEEEEKKKKKEEEEEKEIVLRVDMHCEACARKIARSLRGFEGVEEVKTDSKASKVVVKGKAADPVKICKRLQKKSGRKVELVSPLPKSPEEEKKEEEKKAEPQPPVETEKEEAPAVVTVVLSIRMHCEACAQVLQKRIRKIKGVESVETNVTNDQVTVKGVLDAAKLVAEVYKRTRKQAGIVKEEEKKKEDDEEAKKKDEKKEEEEKKKKEEKGNGNKEENEDEKKNNDAIKRVEHWPSKYYTDYSYAPQIFSDENPNACSVM